MGSEGMEELTQEQCWKVLSDEAYGRLAYVLDGEVNIVPINHVVHDRQIIFTTGPGSKLVGLDEQVTVAYEVDDIDEHDSISVVVRGFVVPLEGEEAREAASGLRPWIDSPKVEVMEIVPSTVTGRIYHFGRH